jgi:hypothetical protein
MFPFLSHRWLRIPLWVYLLSFTLATAAFILMSRSTAIARFEIKGVYIIEGFTRDQQSLGLTKLPSRNVRTILMLASSAKSNPSFHNAIGRLNHAAISDNKSWCIQAEEFRCIEGTLNDWYHYCLGKDPAPSILDDSGNYYHVYVVDISRNWEVTKIATTDSVPEFAITPQGDAVAVLDYHSGSDSTSVTWYSLPPGPAFHSKGQWFIIVGCFLVPISLFYLRSFIEILK